MHTNRELITQWFRENYRVFGPYDDSPGSVYIGILAPGKYLSAGINNDFVTLWIPEFYDSHRTKIHCGDPKLYNKIRGAIEFLRVQEDVEPKDRERYDPDERHISSG